MNVLRVTVDNHDVCFTDDGYILIKPIMDDLGYKDQQYQIRKIRKLGLFLRDEKCACTSVPVLFFNHGTKWLETAVAGQPGRGRTLDPDIQARLLWWRAFFASPCPDYRSLGVPVPEYASPSVYEGVILAARLDDQDRKWATQAKFNADQAQRWIAQADFNADQAQKWATQDKLNVEVRTTIQGLKAKVQSWWERYFGRTEHSANLPTSRPL